MDRRTLLAIALILAFLIGDQVFMAWWTRRHHPPQPVATADSTLVGGVPGGASAPGSAPGSSLGGSTATAPQSAASTGHTAVALGSMPKIAAAPIVERKLETDLFDATFTSEGGTISSWVLPKYRDLTHKDIPVNLIPEGQRAMKLWVSTAYFDYDFSNVPFRVLPAAAFDSSITFVAEDSSGIRVQRTYRVSSNSPTIDVEQRILVPAEMGPIRFRYGWGCVLPLTETSVRPHDVRAVALIGDKQEEY
ncbi:MAG: membrane protein insertase YidC, partial [Candidatus Eiseniibacteriota bacterium]